MKSIRIVLTCVGIFGAIFLPPWVPALCILLLALRFRAWEAIALGLFVDLLWLSPGAGFHGLPIFTIGAIVVVWGLEPLRGELLSQ